MNKLETLLKLASLIGDDDRTAAAGEPVPVLVCTDKRGVIFGYTTDPHARPIVLTAARMCLYWSADVGGVFGLAENGPTEGCKISAPAPRVTLEGVTAVFDVADAAVTAWKSAPVQGRS
jgi:hypothetical protein